MAWLDGSSGSLKSTTRQLDGFTHTESALVARQPGLNTSRLHMIRRERFAEIEIALGATQAAASVEGAGRKLQKQVSHRSTQQQPDVVLLHRK